VLFPYNQGFGGRLGKNIKSGQRVKCADVDEAAVMSEETSPDASERIDLKQAIRVAKAQVADMLEGESYSQLGHEEVKYDDRNDEWLITLGLNRPWNIEKEARGSIAYGLPTSITRQLRSYKKIRIDGKTGRFISMEGHD